MMSKAECVITTDTTHDPPRWIRVQGLKSFDVWDRAGVPLALFGGSLAVLMILLGGGWQPSIPTWGIFLLFFGYLAVGMLALAIYLRRVRELDIDELRSASAGENPLHREAILAALFGGGHGMGVRQSSIDLAGFCDVYRAQHQTPPSALLYRVEPPDREPPNVELPFRVSSDAVEFSSDSIRRNTLLILYLLGVAIALLAVFWTVSRPVHHWIGALAAVPVFLAMLIYPLRAMFPSIGGRPVMTPGVIECAPWFRRKSLSAEDSLLVVIATKNRTTAAWRRADSAYPVFQLHYRSPDDPRLQTILKLWIADPDPPP